MGRVVPLGWSRCKLTCEPSSSSGSRAARVEEMLLGISEIRPYLYLTGFGCITEKKLRELGVTHAVDATNLNSRRLNGIVYLNVPVDDTAIAKLDEHFEEVAKFVDEAKASGGKALIYCAAGVSRSASLVMMYLVISEGLSLKEAYYAVNSVRPIISPNIGFWRQMLAYERKIRGEESVELISGRTAKPIPSVYLRRTLAA